MSRLPQPGGDEGQWGQILNDFLGQVHNTDGTLKNNVITEAQLATSVTSKLNVVAGQQGATGPAGPQGETGPTGPAGTVADATTSAKGAVRLSGDLSGTADAPTVNNMAKAAYGGQETIAVNAAAAGAVTLNLANGNIFSLTLTGNVTLTLTGAIAGKACSFSLYLKQDTTGGRTVTWQSGTKWSGGTSPTLSTGAGAIDVIVFESIDGGTTWFGSLVGTNFS